MPPAENLNFALFPGQTHPSQPISLSAQATSDLHQYGRGRAIVNEWFRIWIEPATQDISPPLAHSIATPARTAELLLFMEHFLRFRTIALRDLLTTPPDIAYFLSREMALLDWLGRYWEAFQQRMCEATLPLPRALDTSVKLCPKTESEHRNRFVVEWFSSNGLDLRATQSIFERDAFQELKRRIALHYGNDRAVGGWDKRRYWAIFSTALKRSSEQSDKQLEYFVGFDGWQSRFTLFNTALLRGAPLDAMLASLRCIHDPVTLGGAFAVGAVHKSSRLPKEERSKWLGRTMIFIINHALRALSQGSDACAEEAVAAFLAISRYNL
ncbi:uncharacterized protein SCHCODRAFT_02697591 [Schizophyllum commune H4-8]|uniref:Uncharacterized protein n=1 Tax=Schizophyllum commune (strain H4-8 / FGSC 9210) TaxID=578458 RepID=D8PYU1_SCHCM|nr:uncharacterized protein SCHCODRAFT_02697591 [Schizophyllum commune H4-8]KAI5896107.1 hypothetical protein SCHCODRAFT_02697591 [Schizophyllum commune H4-8]